MRQTIPQRMKPVSFNWASAAPDKSVRPFKTEAEPRFFCSLWKARTPEADSLPDLEGINREG